MSARCSEKFPPQPALSWRSCLSFLDHLNVLLPPIDVLNFNYFFCTTLLIICNFGRFFPLEYLFVYNINNWCFSYSFLDWFDFYPRNKYTALIDTLSVFYWLEHLIKSSYKMGDEDVDVGISFPYSMLIPEILIL